MQYFIKKIDLIISLNEYQTQTAHFMPILENLTSLKLSFAN